MGRGLGEGEGRVRIARGGKRGTQHEHWSNATSDKVSLARSWTIRNKRTGREGRRGVRG